MTLQRRSALLAASLLTLLPRRPARAGEFFDRILVVGDSQAQGLAGGLQRQFRRDHTWRVIDRSRISTGFMTPNRFDWPASSAGIAESERGALGVVMFGANDRPPVRSQGQVDPMRLSNFITSYGASVRTMAQGLKRWCPVVIWVGHPIVRDPVYAEDMALLNRIFAAQSLASRVDWFPSWPYFIDSAGDYSAYGKGLDGQTTRLRADDGVHLSPAGYDVLANALIPVLEADRVVATHTQA